MALEIVIGIAAAALVVGLGIGYLLFGGVFGKKNKVSLLEQELETAQTELADYKEQVVGQFADTAEKFRALDKSYGDLHRQLAQSSVALCGDAGTALLAGPGAEESENSEGTILAGADPVDVDTQTQGEIDDEHAAETAQDEVIVAEVDVEQQTDTVAVDTDAEASVEVEVVSVEEASEVPILTDVDAQEADPRRETA